MVVSVAGGIDAPSLVRLLADGRLHSGERLAQALGVSRAAVWKGVLRLRQRGIDVIAVPRRGYCLESAVELLDAALIRAPLSAERGRRLRSLGVEFEVDSTNLRLLAGSPPPYGSADALVCELQHAGRGRRGRQWTAPFGGSIALSLGWSFVDAARASPTLSLCVGVAVARALERAGASRIGVKWPNDLWFDDRKVGGVLTEVRAEASGPAFVVIGVGVNVALSASARAQIEASGARSAAVADACTEPLSRNFLAGAMLDELLSMLTVFEREGFAAFRDEWSSFDVLRDRPAEVITGDVALAGVARGVDAQGCLRLERDGRVHEFVSGEVSLRGMRFT